MTISPLAIWKGPVLYQRPNRARAGNAPPRLVVLHTMEGSHEPTPDGLARWMSSPLNFDQSSSHYGVFLDGTIAAYVPEEYTAFAAPPLNDQAIEVEQAGHAAFTREDWLGRSGEIAAARRLVADLCNRYGIPRVFVDAASLLSPSGGRGVTYHSEVNKAFHNSTHTDPGAGYPLDLVLDPLRWDLPQPALRIGAHGPEVLKLQHTINFWLAPITCGPEDGDFGPQTQAGVIAAQAELNRRGFATGKPDGVWNWLEYNAFVTILASLGIIAY